jgi:hypothetical protein
MRGLTFSSMLAGAVFVPTNALAVTPAAAEPRDGQHDFDFEIGTWKIHLKRLMNPLTGSTHWVEFDGTSVTRSVWDGRANLEEFEVDSPTGHIEGLRAGHAEWQNDPRSVCLVRHHTHVGPLRTILLGRWRQNVGSELDHGPDSSRERTGQSALTPRRDVAQAHEW